MAVEGQKGHEMKGLFILCLNTVSVRPPASTTNPDLMNLETKGPYAASRSPRERGCWALFSVKTNICYLYRSILDLPLQSNISLDTALFFFIIITCMFRQKEV